MNKQRLIIGGDGASSHKRDKLKIKILFDASSLPIRKYIKISYISSQLFWHFSKNNQYFKIIFTLIKWKVPKRLWRYIRNFYIFSNREWWGIKSKDILVFNLSLLWDDAPSPPIINLCLFIFFVIKF